MTYLTLKSYIRKEFERYLQDYYPNSKKYLALMLKESQADYRLAVISQCYFYTHKSIEAGNMFSALTNEKYDSLEEFQASENKYVDQFRTVVHSQKRAKKPMIAKIQHHLNTTNITISKLAREVKVDRSNLHKVLKYGKYHLLSTTKIATIFRYVKQQNAT